MRGPVPDFVLLILLVLFFGLQQRGRGQVYFRYWFAGWILYLGSFAVWVMQFHQPLLKHLQEAARFDLLLLASLTFLISFLASEPLLWSTLLKGLPVGIPSVLIIDAVLFCPVPRYLLALAVVLWHLQGIRTARMVLPASWPRRRALVYMLCIAFCVVILSYLWTARVPYLQDFASGEVLIFTAILYFGKTGRRSLAGVVGTIGFVAWGAGYILRSYTVAPEVVALVALFWSFPKYFVGFSMILRVVEESTEETSHSLRRTEELYQDFRLLYENHPHPTWICDAATGRILSANQATVSIYGYNEDELQRMCTADLDAADDAEHAAIEQFVPRPPDGDRVRHRYKDGSLAWVNLIGHSIEFQGRPARLMMARDVTSRMKMNMELVRRAHHDELTGLPNRALLDDRLQLALDTCQRDQRKAALLTIDIDHFKQVNDTHGHPVGDACLQAVATRLQSKIRQADTLARIGGEEFIAMIGALRSADDARTVATALLRLFDEPLQLPECRVQISISIGVAVYPDDGEKIEALRRRSDEALYEAKRGGRNCAVLASEVQFGNAH